MTTAACRGFVYATAVMGVTGARATTSDLAGPLVARTQARRPTCRSASGSGVSNGDQAAEVASYADGVIVGSAFVRALLDHPTTGPRACARWRRSPRTSPRASGVRRVLRRACCRSSCAVAADRLRRGAPRRRFTGAVLDRAVRRARRPR